LLLFGYHAGDETIDGQKFNIDGRVVGKVNDLNIPAIDFQTLSNTRVIASLHLKGLPNVDKMSMDLNLKKLTTGRSDIEKLVSKKCFLAE
jgi:hypothetical protein